MPNAEHNATTIFITTQRTWPFGHVYQNISVPGTPTATKKMAQFLCVRLCTCATSIGGVKL